MKTDFMKKCYAQYVTPHTREMIRLNVGVANRIYDILEERNMSQKEFASLLHKSEAEVSRWLSGTHNFTMSTIAAINAALHEDVLTVPEKQRYIFISLPRDFTKGIPANSKESNRIYQSVFCYEIPR